MKRRFPKARLFAAVPLLLSVLFLFACAGIIRPAEAKYAAHIPAGIIKIKGEEKKEIIRISASYREMASGEYSVNFFVKNMTGGEITITGSIHSVLEGGTSYDYTLPTEKKISPKASTDLYESLLFSALPQSYSAELTIDGQTFTFTGVYTSEPINVTAEAKWLGGVEGPWELGFYVEIPAGSARESVNINGENDKVVYFSETLKTSNTDVLQKTVEKGSRTEITGMPSVYWESSDRPSNFIAYITVDGQPYIFSGNFTIKSDLLSKSLSAFPDPLVYSVFRDDDRLYLDIASGTYSGGYTVSWTHKGMDLLTDGITVNRSDAPDAAYTASFTDGLNARESKRYVFLLSDAFEDGGFTIIYGDNKKAGPYTGSTVTRYNSGTV